MLKSVQTRLVAGIPLAAVVVGGLFVVMNHLVSVEEIELEKVEQRVLTAITPEIEEPDKPKLEEVVAKVETSAKPPPLPRLSASASDIVLPVNFEIGGAPESIDFGNAPSLDLPKFAIDRVLQPLSPPVPVYPNSALIRGIEGDCEVRFDVDARGRPFNIQPNCTHRVFDSEARRAIRNVEFAPEVSSGEARVRSNVIYPLTFRLPN